MSVELFELLIEHVFHLRGLCNVLKEFGLIVNKDKCKFRVEELEFLGHKISKHGLEPLQEKVRVVTNFERPSTVESLQWFLGMINFYRRFITGITTILKALTLWPALSRAWSGCSKWSLPSSLQRHAVLANAMMLAHPIRGAELQLVTDASWKAIGAVIQQVIQGQVQPLAFFSRRTTGLESRVYYIQLGVVVGALSNLTHFPTCWKEDLSNYSIIKSP